MIRTVTIVILALALATVPAHAGDEVEPEAQPAANDAAPAESAPEPAAADEAAAKPSTESDGAKQISGMSVLGNQEAPTSLVIVPWKSSELGDAVGIAAMLDDSRQPVDREVFLRALSYYEIRSEPAP